MCNTGVNMLLASQSLWHSFVQLPRQQRVFSPLALNCRIPGLLLKLWSQPLLWPKTVSGPIELLRCIIRLGSETPTPSFCRILMQHFIMFYTLSGVHRVPYIHTFHWNTFTIKVHQLVSFLFNVTCGWNTSTVLFTQSLSLDTAITLI